MSKQFIAADEFRIINVKYIHSVTLNKDKKWGWIKVVDEEAKFGKYKITTEHYAELAKMLLENDKGEE